VEQFRKELRGWLSEHLTDEVETAGRRRGKDPSGFDLLRTWDASVADAGWGAVSWPRAYGGRGATVLEQLVYARGNHGGTGSDATQRDRHEQHRARNHGVRNGSAEAGAAPRMVRADDICVRAMSEPEAGSDLASLRTRAVRDGAGDDADFVVNGQKTGRR